MSKCLNPSTVNMFRIKEATFQLHACRYAVCFSMNLLAFSHSLHSFIFITPPLSYEYFVSLCIGSSVLVTATHNLCQSKCIDMHFLHIYFSESQYHRLSNHTVLVTVNFISFVPDRKPHLTFSH